MEQLSKVSRSWSKEEDDKLRRQINAESNQNWNSVATKAGLKRTANSCRLRYVNHLKPRARPGKLTVEEKLLVLEFRSQWGGQNLWSKIAKKLLPGRTDNDVKNFWHTLAKKAIREGRDKNSDAILKKRAELVQMINDCGRFTMDYSTLISSDAYDLLKGLFPDITVAGGSAATEAADSSPTDFDVGTPGRVGDTLFPQSVAAITEVDQLMPDVETSQSRVAVERQFQKGFTARFFYYVGDPGAEPGSDLVPEAEPGNFYAIAPQIYVPVQQHQHHGEGPTGFNQVPAALGIAFTESTNQTLSHMQVTTPEYSDLITNTFDVAQQYHAPVEQQGLNGGCLDHGGGPIGLNEAMAAAAALGNTTSNEIDSACSSVDFTSCIRDLFPSLQIVAFSIHNVLQILSSVAPTPSI